MMRTGARTALRASALSQTLPRSNVIIKSCLNTQISTVTTGSQAFQNSNHFHHQYANHSMRPLSRHYSVQSMYITNPKTSKAQQYKFFQPLILSSILGGVLTYFGASWLFSSDEKTTEKRTEDQIERTEDQIERTEDHTEQLKNISPKYSYLEVFQNMTNSKSYEESTLEYMNYCTLKPYFNISRTNEVRKISYWEEILWTLQDIKDGVLYVSRLFSRTCSSLQEGRLISLPFLTFFTVFFLDLSTSRLRRIGRNFLGLFSS